MPLHGKAKDKHPVPRRLPFSVGGIAERGIYVIQTLI